LEFSSQKVRALCASVVPIMATANSFDFQGKTIRFSRFVLSDFVMWCPAPDRITIVVRVGGLGR
jgi:hypothetical protein